MRTIFPAENEGELQARTESHSKSPDSIKGEEDMKIPAKWPKRIEHRGRVWATIYSKKATYEFYRVVWASAGKRLMKSFGAYASAKKFADALVKDIAKGSAVSALSPKQARDALSAIERLEDYRKLTGKPVSLMEAVSTFAETSVKLNGHNWSDVVDGFMRTVATVKRKDVSVAVEEFITAEELRTKASDGKRSQLSPKYAYNRAIMLRRFAGTFPGTALNDLTKDHLDTFIASLCKVASKSRNRKAATSAKSKNHHRAAVRQFLQWAVRKDYLAVTHRLTEAQGMQPERANESEVQFYTPKELQALLDAAEGSMRAMIAISGLAGLRTQELLRLDWADVWRVENHIEITAGKSKTRQRRLVEICPALAKWLKPYRTFTVGKVCNLHEITWQQHFVALCGGSLMENKSGVKVPVTRKPNGLRHSFCTFHYALNGNENLTAMQAGNSPAIIHGHYKGLATRIEANAWFNVRPKRARNVISLAQVTERNTP